MSKPKIPVITIAHVALFVAMQIVLDRYLTINTQLTKINLSFVPIALCAMLYGPKWAGVTAGIADVIGAILVPLGPWYPPLTLTAIASGAVFGLFLHGHEGSLPRYILPAAINSFVISFGISTVFLHFLYGTPLLELYITRIIQCVFMFISRLALLPPLKAFSATLHKRVAFYR